VEQFDVLDPTTPGDMAPALAPRIPEFIAERCVGCMACVSACPDSAILGVVVPAAELDDRIATFAQSEDGASRSTGWASGGIRRATIFPCRVTTISSPPSARLTSSENFALASATEMFMALTFMTII